MAGLSRLQVAIGSGVVVVGTIAGLAGFLIFSDGNFHFLTTIFPNSSILQDRQTGTGPQVTEQDQRSSPYEDDTGLDSSNDSSFNSGGSGQVAGWQLSRSDVGPGGCGVSTDSLTSSGTIKTSHDGQVIEGMNVQGVVIVRHDNVTIRDSRIRVGGSDVYGISYGPSFDSGLGGATVECVEVDGQGSESIGVLFSGSGQTVRRSYIHGFRVGAHWRGNDRWVNNLIDDLHYDRGSHNTSGSIRGKHVDLIGNRFEDGNSAAVSIYPDSTPSVVIEDIDLKRNFWQTPNAHYCVNLGIGDDGPKAQQSSHVRVIDNMWGQDHSSTCGQSGPYHNWDGSKPGTEWRDNMYQDGSPVEG